MRYLIPATEQSKALAIRFELPYKIGMKGRALIISDCTDRQMLNFARWAGLAEFTGIKDGIIYIYDVEKREIGVAGRVKA